MSERITYQQFLYKHLRDQPGLTTLLESISNAAAGIAEELSRISFTGPADPGTVNLHGESRHHMDQYAETLFLTALSESRACFAVLSEEQTEMIQLTSALSQEAAYIIALDPLDGSSNIDVNIPVGSIFSIYDRFKTASPSHPAAVLQDMDGHIASGYVLYSTTTMIVLALPGLVTGFTLDSANGGFVLSHANIRIPDTGNIYSVNDGNYHDFDRGTQNYIRFCRQQKEFYERPFTARYVGSMVADIHRTLLKGGIFLYPATMALKEGKLRLAYECRPMAYIVEQAGGRASTGSKEILDLPLRSPHQRVPVVIGSEEMVNTAKRLLNACLPVNCEAHV
ncbi:fructose-1,6-bisphosphatase [Mucilaginibacter conchicola]|uniref:Fructose-1,6-bisphosphatase class 1 n=1 Tax=Mucilaginibacter conchicola TaxID=2303333 RepID=A0A372NRZ8_9SPHI|nr:class 1 fructose-bisphosphatase [Mucilaginibacter conchicola]RFZ91125.1 fructose-1,6-bisphosphatase [Mucilaginibacter conchicola]